VCGVFLWSFVVSVVRVVQVVGVAAAFVPGDGCEDGAGPAQPICTHGAYSILGRTLLFGLGSCDFDFGFAFGFWHLIIINSFVGLTICCLGIRGVKRVWKGLKPAKWVRKQYPTLDFIQGPKRRSLGLARPFSGELTSSIGCEISVCNFEVFNGKKPKLHRAFY